MKSNILDVYKEILMLKMKLRSGDFSVVNQLRLAKKSKAKYISAKDNS